MRLLFWTDCHLADRPPAARTQRYADEVFEKMKEVKEIAATCDVTVFGGDLYHNPRPRDVSHALVRRTIEFLRDWPTELLVVVGNHDQVPEQLAGLGRTPLGVVLEALAGTQVKLLDDVLIGDVQISAAHWSHELDENPALYNLQARDGAAFHVKVVHGMCLAPGEYPFPCVIMDQVQTEADVVLIGHCVAYDTPVHLAGGGTRRMGAIVGRREPHIVMSLDLRTLAVTEMPVKSWYRRRVTSDWYHLQLSRGRPGPGPKGRGVFLTGDHPVLTPDGWRRAKAIKSGDCVVTSEPMPSPQQLEVLTGTLLGDASLVQRRQGRATLVILHGRAQEQWGALKAAGLSGLGMRRQKSRWCRWESRLAAFGALAERWYPDGHKVVPDDFNVHELTSLVLATWYGDDGSIDARGRIRLATQGFAASDIERLVALLANRGFSFRVETQGYLQCRDSGLFLNEIAPYLPSCLRYKLPKEIEEESPFAAARWVLPEPHRFVDQVLVSTVEPRRGRGWSYCIDVEGTQNFIAGGFVLHNCHWVTEPVRYNGTLFLGPGAIARTARAQHVSDTVYVAILTLEAGREPEVELRPLKSARPADEVFAWTEARESPTTGLFAGYVAVLESGLDVGGLSVEDALTAVEMQAPEGVVRRTKEYLKEAGL